ncbi:hypothetical protein F4779DRAFT_185161 [Xylariaceae sp. FL0662B]|nr:hypothetical protein F4779DRAFT_185161 [Xylariaceae sp. FL0662B]
MKFITSLLVRNQLERLGDSTKQRDIGIMCTDTAYTLRCEHVVTRILYCSDAPPPSRGSRKQRTTCSWVIRNSVPWPPPPEFGSEVTCPLARCPFTERGGYWNCCWCGKEVSQERTGVRARKAQPSPAPRTCMINLTSYLVEQVLTPSSAVE